MTPDFDRAATAALEILKKYDIRKAPIEPIHIFKAANGFNVVTFSEMSSAISMDRKDLISSFEAHCHDAVSSVYLKDGRPYYLIAYNAMLPQHLVQRALAREMGHVVLGHDGSRPEDVRNAEAICFAQHLLSPRPLIHALQESGIKITVEVLGNITGCFEHCLMCMQGTPATHVPPDLNREIRDQFAEYVSEFLDFQSYLGKSDKSMIANFGTFMDGYEE